MGTTDIVCGNHEELVINTSIGQVALSLQTEAFASALHNDSIFIVYSDDENCLRMVSRKVEKTGSEWSLPRYCQPPNFKGVEESFYKIKSGIRPILKVFKDFMLMIWTDNETSALLKAYFHFRPVNVGILNRENNDPNSNGIYNSSYNINDPLYGHDFSSEYWSRSSHVLDRQADVTMNHNSGMPLLGTMCEKSWPSISYTHDDNISLSWKTYPNNTLVNVKFMHGNIIDIGGLVENDIAMSSSPSVIHLEADKQLVVWAGITGEVISFTTMREGRYSIQGQVNAAAIREGTSPLLCNVQEDILLIWCDNNSLNLYGALWNKQTENFGPPFMLKDSLAPFQTRVTPAVSSGTKHSLLAWLTPGYSQQIHYSILSKPEVVKKIESMKGAVLLIGSLMWQNDSSKKTGDMERLIWRIDNLRGKPIKVKVPIRYGRLSEAPFKKWRAKGGEKQEANQLYTMVFSSEVEQKDYGTGYLFMLQNDMINEDIILSTVKSLSKAEGIYEEGGNEAARKRINYFNNSWGGIAIFLNKKSHQYGFLKNIWQKNFNPTNGPKSSLYSSKFGLTKCQQTEHREAVVEKSVIDIDGVMNINILTEDNTNLFDDERYKHLSFVISCVTSPKVKSIPTIIDLGTDDLDEYRDYFEYPSPEEIAMLAKRDLRKYFLNNLRCGITTFQDYAILEHFASEETTI